MKGRTSNNFSSVLSTEDSWAYTNSPSRSWGGIVIILSSWFVKKYDVFLIRKDRGF
jgi:hypothetical protein